MPDRSPMPTIGGLSVRTEIDARIDAARLEARTAAIVEVVDFLHRAGFAEAADALDNAAFTEVEDHD